MRNKIEKKKREQQDERNAIKQGLYQKILDEAERLDFEMPAEVDGIDDEIALLRIEIKKAISGGDISRLKAMVVATNALEKLIRTRYQISGDRKKKLKDAISTVLRDVALPLGIGVGTSVIEKKM